MGHYSNFDDPEYAAAEEAAKERGRKARCEEIFERCGKRVAYGDSLFEVLNARLTRIDKLKWDIDLVSITESVAAELKQYIDKAVEKSKAAVADNQPGKIVYDTNGYDQFPQVIMETDPVNMCIYTYEKGINKFTWIPFH